MALGRPIQLTGNVASKVIRVLATEGQTVFTVTGGYRINQLGVFRNGVRLSNNSDFTSLDGVTVTLINAASLNDEILFQIQDDFRVADAIVGAASSQVIEGDLVINGNLYANISPDDALGVSIRDDGVLVGTARTINVLGAGTTTEQIGETTNVTIAVGVQSGGTLIGNAQTLNFVGTGNTFQDNGDGTIDVSISGGSGGGGGGGLGTAINYSDDTPSPFSYFDATATVTEDLLLDQDTAGVSSSYIVSVIPNIIVAAGAAVTVGAGKTMIIDVLKVGDL